MVQPSPARPSSPASAEKAVEKELFAALRISAICGGCGFLVGGTAGILKGTTPFLFASISGIQTFCLGGLFSGSRAAFLQSWPPEQRTASNQIKASAAAGAFTGAVLGAVYRGRANVLPGAIMFGLFGGLGQSAMNKYRANRDGRARMLLESTGTQERERGDFWKRMCDKKWSPFTSMSDEQYAALLKDRMLKLDVEIAIIDDKISALQQQQQESTMSDKPKTDTQESTTR